MLALLFTGSSITRDACSAVPCFRDGVPQARSLYASFHTPRGQPHRNTNEPTRKCTGSNSSTRVNGNCWRHLDPHSLMTSAMRENAMSWNRENTASMTPAASPSLPLTGAAMNAATGTSTMITEARMVAMYWKACAAETEVRTVRVHIQASRDREGGKSDTRKVAGNNYLLSPPTLYGHEAGSIKYEIRHQLPSPCETKKNLNPANFKVPSCRDSLERGHQRRRLRMMPGRLPYHSLSHQHR